MADVSDPPCNADLEFEEYLNKKPVIQLSNTICIQGYKHLKHLFQVPLFILFFIIIGYVLLGGYMFYKSESWGYGNAAYFCVITLTTIGFGDFVPKPQRESSEVSPELR